MRNTFLTTPALPLSVFLTSKSLKKKPHLASSRFLTLANCFVVIKATRCSGEPGQNPVNWQHFFYCCSFLWRAAGMSAIFPSTRDATTHCFLRVCLHWNVPLMWDRFITYLLSGLAWLFVGPTSDHFRCLTPDHEVMAACKHSRHELESRNVCVLVFVWVWE